MHQNGNSDTLRRCLALDESVVSPEIRQMSTKPVIAVSMGDPAGISPEIIAATVEEIACSSRAVVFGHRAAFESVLPKAHQNLFDWQAAPCVPEDGRIVFVHCGPGGAPIERPGALCAEAQLEALARAVDFVLLGGASALVTAPVAKSEISSIIPGFSGHTEYLAERAGLAFDDVTMMFSADDLCVGLVSTHVALREVPDFITPRRLRRTFDHLEDMLLRLRPDEKPKIALAALNPHAGEHGLFGDEEETLIAPFCKEAAARGNAEVFGPVPADSLYRDAFSGKYTGVVSMYHDQAMLPLKLHGVGRMVNVTMGLPFIRTSPDHGTAYDIARKGLADPAGFQTAFRLAVRMASAEKQFG
jgi:4-phospho-D-threonate 3-dehydrogenase / 4-phospho-D-erythronate 3-dehydrogenase